MKFLETHFEEYINVSQTKNLHTKLEKIFQKFPNKIQDFKNVIFYGPSGAGKYTQMLKSIKKYSPSELKYEKKISIMFNKQPFFFKISDIHYEVDMSLLGCNSKLLWHEIYVQIIDIISAKTEKSGIIVCKHFHDIYNELLDNFYSYMQENNSCIDIKFIILTEEISFIPDNILNCCNIISISRPSKAAYTKCINIIPKNMKVENIQNIKNLHLSITDLMQPYKIICDKIIREIIANEIHFLKFRDLLYDIFIYHLNITECIWYILNELMKQNKISPEKLSPLLIKTYQFLQYYNNNYRPIYHLESYLFYLVNIIHGYKYDN
jgi:hypothetical protein